MKRSSRVVRVSIAALAVLLMGIAVGTSVNAASVPSIFLNDERWYRDSIAGAEYADDVLCVPLDVFELFPKVGLSVDRDNDEFMAYNRDTRLYVSVLLSSGLAMVNGVEYTDLRIYKAHDCYYVPVEFFCSVLGLDCEDVPSNSPCGRTVRIFDGSQSRPVSDLIGEYTERPTSATTAPPQTTAPVPPPDEKEHTICFLFVGIDPEALNDVLLLMEENGVPAVFCLSQDELRTFPAAAVSALTMRHKLGLIAERKGDPDDFILSLTAANEILYGTSKTKTHLVFEHAGKSALFTKAESDYIALYGFHMIQATYETKQLETRRDPVNAVLNACRTAARDAKVTVFGMPANRITAEVLAVLLPELKEKTNYTFRLPTEAEP